MEKIDVCINVYGKPYQTLVTLKSLLYQSSDKIDKIYFIEEANQPNDYDFNIINENLNYDGLIRYKPKYWLSWETRYGLSEYEIKNDIDSLYSLRYEYGIRNTDKKYILLIHNDMLFIDDVIKFYTDNIDSEYFGLGPVGQCWNCPMNYADLCDGKRLKDNIKKEYSYKNILEVFEKHPPVRQQTKNYINKKSPLPLPECRINEWCALINVDIYKKNVMPFGKVHPLGGYFSDVDLGDTWFREMVDAGYEFKNISDDDTMYYHSCFTSDEGYLYSNLKGKRYKVLGHETLFDVNAYKHNEILAKKYFYENF